MTKLFSELVTLFHKYELSWEKMFGFISSMAVSRIAKEKLLQENEKSRILSLSLIKKKCKIKTPPAEVTAFLLQDL
jgi:hypothetical protein